LNPEIWRPPVNLSLERAVGSAKSFGPPMTPITPIKRLLVFVGVVGVIGGQFHL
jgi:hypothetical protein